VIFKNVLKSAAIISAASLVLAGCAPTPPEPVTPNASGAPAEFLSYYEQEAEFEECGTRLYCADIEVPMDWNDPNSEAISIATVFRQADNDPKGFVLFNPGGPGVSGYDWVKESSDYLGTDALRKDWNILGFDPRGVGRSSAVSCLSDSEYDEFLYGVSGYDIGTEEDIAAAREATAEFASKCLENTGDLLEFVDTVSAAKDMDVLRAVIGQSELNFLGYSYGSFLGTTYATLFPERVGRFVLDGAIDPTVSDFEQTLFQIEAFESALTAFLENCDTFEDCPFTGDVPADLERIQQLLLAIEEQPLPTELDNYQVIQAVVDRLSRTMDEDALRAIAAGIPLNLDTEAAAQESAERLRVALKESLDSLALAPEVIVQKEDRTERFRLLLSRRIHGNLKLSAISSDFIHGDDYQSLTAAARALSGKVLPGSRVRRGDPEKSQKEQVVADFRAAFAWLLSEAERVVSRQRYKGLGEMNPQQLWETTMDTTTRTLLRVQIEDAIVADQVFTTLMGDEVDPRRAFIEKNALIARNLDV